jgi:hypothetical protein
MQKNIIVVSVLFLFLLLATYNAIFQQSDGQKDEYYISAFSLYKSVEEKMEKIRGFEVDVPFTVVDKRWVLERWGAEAIDEEYLNDEEIFYKALLLVPSDFRFEERRNKEVGSFMAFYWEGKIYVVRENFNPTDNSSGEALAHELEHAIQDRFGISSDDTFDGDKAYGAIVEGDAILAGWLYSDKSVENQIKATGEKISCDNEPNKGYDSNLHLIFYFPYLFGSKFIGSKYLEGGYAEVDKILENPPSTTEQIMHPEKAGEGFEKVDAGFDSSGFDPQWRVVRDDRMGEFFIYIFLSTHLNDCVAEKAAEGWNGDNLKLIRKNGEFSFVWKISFDSKMDADEFEVALLEMLRKLGEKRDDWWILELNNEKITYERDGKYITIIGKGEAPLN